jgi:hypothetical protein
MTSKGGRVSFVAKQGLRTGKVKDGLLADRLGAEGDNRPTGLVVLGAGRFLDADHEAGLLEDIHVVLDELDVDGRELEHAGSAKVLMSADDSTRTSSVRSTHWISPCERMRVSF